MTTIFDPVLFAVTLAKVKAAADGGHATTLTGPEAAQLVIAYRLLRAGPK